MIRMGLQAFCVILRPFVCVVILLSEVAHPQDILLRPVQPRHGRGDALGSAMRLMESAGNLREALPVDLALTPESFPEEEGVRVFGFLTRGDVQVDENLLSEVWIASDLGEKVSSEKKFVCTAS